MANNSLNILNRISDFYLESRDFNGLPIRPENLTGKDIKAVEELLRQGLVQVVSENDFPNPHIKPWASRRSVAEQIKDMASAHKDGTPQACLYPTPKSMKTRIEGRFRDEPYRKRLAQGYGMLEPAYFSMDVLEPYRNDPRYHFTTGDFESSFGIGDNAYLDAEQPERDKISLVRAGFAYDPSTLDSEHVKRYLCVFLTDLGNMTPEHQRRWETYEERDISRLQPHPVWWAMMMGHWPEGIGVFDKIRGEMNAINQLADLIYGERLFASTERPRGWGWVLRASSQEWEQFIHTTDKLLSENLRHAFFAKAGVKKADNQGQQLGTIKRLELLLAEKTSLPERQREQVIQPMKKVRTERQRPAHIISRELSDVIITSRQRDILGAIVESLYILRRLFMNHSKSADWKPDEWLEGTWYRL